MAIKTTKSGATRYMIVGALIIGAFLGAYQFAQARTGAGPTATAPLAANGAVPAGAAAAGDPAAGDPAASSSGCACCGSSAPTAGGITGDEVKAAAEVAGDVQTISVDLAKGYYEPNVITLKAGVPAEITFGQSSGCTGQVMSKDLGFFEDLTTGAKTIKVPALDAGEYAFSCGMEMVFGKIVVE